mmetsp:Transcript_50383/g.161269  ORF Transcript_50383/g.161269 Transcript_50383/m.161269 type:complete len:240 (-) Transcript_50383:120-839(-)
MSAGSQPGRTGSAVAFIQTVCCGGFMFGSVSSKAAASLSCAGFMSGVWKAPEALMSRACRALAFSASAWHSSTAAFVPATAKPFWKRKLEIWQTSSSPRRFLTSAQRPWSLFTSRPATESMACGHLFVASFMASARSFTSASPSAKLKTPAAQSAAYSPTPRPAAPWKRAATPSCSAWSFSRHARHAMKLAGRSYLGCSSFFSCPRSQRSRTLKSRISPALSSMSLTAGRPTTSGIRET